MGRSIATSSRQEQQALLVRIAQRIGRDQMAVDQKHLQLALPHEVSKIGTAETARARQDCPNTNTLEDGNL